MTRPTVQSVERSFAILGIVAQGASGVTEIAGRARLPKSTVARLLTTLEALGAVEQAEEGTDYRLGPRLAELSGPVDPTAALTAVVQPHLQRLSAALGEATGFVVPAGGQVRLVSQVESPNAVQVRDYTGMLFPAHIGASGVALMAEWSEREVGDYLAGPLEAFTAKTVVDPPQVTDRLARARHDQYCWVHDEFAEGISSVAAVVRGRDGRALGAVQAHGPTYRFPVEGEADQVAELVRSTARLLSATVPPDRPDVSRAREAGVRRRGAAPGWSAAGS